MEDASRPSTYKNAVQLVLTLKTQLATAAALNVQAGTIHPYLL
jgi:hypothetical protein